MDTKTLVNWIRYLMRIDKMDKFYKSKHFIHLKNEVLREQHYECQRCKEHGTLTIVRADGSKSGVVHHVKEVKKHPELALSKYYTDDNNKEQRQLIVLCNGCHEIVHDRCVKKKPLTEERW